MNSAATNYRFRTLLPTYASGWEEETDESKVAAEIIETPEKHLLNANDLYNAEGGNAGLAIQTGSVFAGLTGLAIANPALSNAYRAGALGRF